MQAALRRTCFLSSRTLPRATSTSRVLSRPVLSRSIVTKKYTEEHEWVSFDDSTGIGTVSITEHAQAALGDVVFVELPAVGIKVTQGDQMGAVESVKAASDIYAPVSGTIEAVNETLSSEPGLLNKSPEDKGWLCKIKLSNPSEMDKLLSDSEYKVKCEE
ncbi:hypothetical protein D9758_000212 [Tetrapyrgos nigripes]|uniref:Glycine cleavage system H protein n=1 Tax=Tetrapyrgos nigripes TaxID=182062 RepID=A0A8H5H177_9AGAR|nr:hypothetical protein D9758_000212 [Tetrapyrgos nigripes]